MRSGPKWMHAQMRRYYVTADAMDYFTHVLRDVCNCRRAGANTRSRDGYLPEGFRVPMTFILLGG